MKIALTVGPDTFVGDSDNIDLKALEEVCIVENFTGCGAMGTMDAGMAYGVGANQQRRNPRLRRRRRRRVRENDESALLQHRYAQQLRLNRARDEMHADKPVNEAMPHGPIAKRLMREGTLFPKDAREDTTYGKFSRTDAKVAISRQDLGDEEKTSAMDVILGRPQTKAVPTVPPISGSGKGVPPPTPDNSLPPPVPPVAEPTTQSPELPPPAAPQPESLGTPPPGIPSPASFAMSESAGAGGFNMTSPPPPPPTNPVKTLGNFRGFI